MIAIIPARGGSKGLPGKNIRPLLSKPLIAYTIEAAQKSRHISDIIISTDDDEIADIAVEYGAKCPFMRPETLSGDDSLAVDNYIYTIDRLIAEFDYEIESFVVLQPTSPLRTESDIDGAIELFELKKADSVITFCEENHPVEWNKYIDDDGKLEVALPKEDKNRQKYRVSYYPNGAVYVFKCDLIRSRQYYSERSYAYVMQKNRSVDIDTLDDFNYVDFLMRGDIER